MCHISRTQPTPAYQQKQSGPVFLPACNTGRTSVPTTGRKHGAGGTGRQGRERATEKRCRQNRGKEKRSVSFRARVRHQEGRGGRDRGRHRQRQRPRHKGQRDQCKNREGERDRAEEGGERDREGRERERGDKGRGWPSVMFLLCAVTTHALPDAACIDYTR